MHQAFITMRLASK